MPIRSERRPSLLTAGALLAGALVLGTAGTADADVSTAFADLRAGIEQRIAEFEPDPAKRKVVKALREASSALATLKGTLSKDAKKAGVVVLALERSVPGDGLLFPSVQRLVDEFHIATVGDQQTLQSFLAALPESGKRRRAEKSALAATEIFGAFGEAPTQSARMAVIRRTAASIEKGYRVGGARKGTFVVAVIDATTFASFAPAATVGASGDPMAPHAFSFTARFGPAARSHRRLDVGVKLPLLGPGITLLGAENVGRVSLCPGGAAPCSEFATDAEHSGSVNVGRFDTGYRLVSGSFQLVAADGLGGTMSVGIGVFRTKYE